MSGLTAFATAFCTVCILSAGLNMLCPAGGLEKSVKYVFSLVFLLCVITALPGLKNIDISIPEYEGELKTQEMNEAATKLTFRLALKNAGINFSKITVCTDKTADGGIIITKVIVYSSEPQETIRQVLGGDGAEYAVEVIS